MVDTNNQEAVKLEKVEWESKIYSWLYPTFCIDYTFCIEFYNNNKKKNLLSAQLQNKVLIVSAQ